MSHRADVHCPLSPLDFPSAWDVAMFRDLEVGWIQQRLFTRVAKIRPTVYVWSSPCKQQGWTNRIALLVNVDSWILLAMKWLEI